MSEKIKLEMISRRGAFSLLGMAAALGLVVPVAVITATDAEARVGNPASAVSVAGANRRDRRQDRRYKKKKKKPTDSEEKNRRQVRLRGYRRVAPSALRVAAQCPLLAQSGHAELHCTGLLSGG